MHGDVIEFGRKHGLINTGPTRARVSPAQQRSEIQRRLAERPGVSRNLAQLVVSELLNDGNGKYTAKVEQMLQADTPEEVVSVNILDVYSANSQQALQNQLASGELIDSLVDQQAAAELFDVFRHNLSLVASPQMRRGLYGVFSVHDRSSYTALEAQLQREQAAVSALNQRLRAANIKKGPVLEFLCEGGVIYSPQSTDSPLVQVCDSVGRLYIEDYYADTDRYRFAISTALVADMTRGLAALNDNSDLDR